jgi:uncharacterized protein (DUF4415 family)
LKKMSKTTAEQQHEDGAPSKERIWLGLDREVVAHFRATGRYWNKSTNEVFADYVKQHGK